MGESTFPSFFGSPFWFLLRETRTSFLSKANLFRYGGISAPIIAAPIGLMNVSVDFSSTELHVIYFPSEADDSVFGFFQA